MPFIHTIPIRYDLVLHLSFRLYSHFAVVQSSLHLHGTAVVYKTKPHKFFKIENWMKFSLLIFSDANFFYCW